MMPAPRGRRILTINAGSSSIKLAAYVVQSAVRRTLTAQLSGIGGTRAAFSWTDGDTSEDIAVDAPHVDAATRFVLGWLDDRGLLDSIDGIGHRVVHGLDRTAPARVTPELLSDLRGAVAYAPEHLPAALALIDACAHRRPQLPQVACFDTAFHAAMPPVATLLPIPRRFQTSRVRRYGFHGLSCEYLIEELARLAGSAIANGRVLLAHLGNGASITAAKGGRSLDTTMAFTPAAGLMMGTRTGDLDPGVLLHLARTENLTIAQLDRMVHHESGLLGVSGRSADMRELLAHERHDEAAAQAVALFCYGATKQIGALATVLGGLDTLVFSAGIGERSAPIRARICDGLAFLGVELDDRANVAHAPVISSDASRVAVRVIPTDEQLMIARSVCRLLDTARDDDDCRHARTA
jgi:acetate kinase